MGWQGKDPSTDFRGGGFISLENLLYFARKFPVRLYNNQLQMLLKTVFSLKHSIPVAPYLYPSHSISIS
jgi:hypothetical protein